MIALDASALLAFLFREPGHERVAEALGEACISAVNLSEVLGRFARDGHDPLKVLAQIRISPLEIVPFGSDHAALAASLVPLVRNKGLSLGDRACLALAASRGIPALTADRSWADVDVGVVVGLIR